MKDRDWMSSQGGQGQGTKPGHSVAQPERGTPKPGQGGGTQQHGGREGQRGSDKPAARPSPSGVPNEGRATPRQAKQGYEYKGGRQSTGGIPNPDDLDDSKSAGSFRGTAEEYEEVDDAEDKGDVASGTEPSVDKQQNNVFRYPEY